MMGRRTHCRDRQTKGSLWLFMLLILPLIMPLTAVAVDYSRIPVLTERARTATDHAAASSARVAGGLDTASNLVLNAKEMCDRTAEFFGVINEFNSKGIRMEPVEYTYKSGLREISWEHSDCYGTGVSTLPADLQIVWNETQVELVTKYEINDTLLLAGVMRMFGAADTNYFGFVRSTATTCLIGVAGSSTITHDGIRRCGYLQANP